LARRVNHFTDPLASLWQSIRSPSSLMSITNLSSKEREREGERIIDAHPAVHAGKSIYR
jgi:hypothetical protein